MYLFSPTFSRRSTSTQAFRTALVGLLATALIAFAAGCGGAGANGGGDGDGDGDGGGDGIEAPAAPSSLEGESLDGEVELTWSEVGEADSYSVYRDTQSGVDPSGTPLESGLTETSYADTGVENGTTYYYRVTAVKTDGEEEAESDGSEEIEKTPFDDPPDRPQ
jgi:hypothetical protein